jgi:hypothetical protein
MNKGNWKGSTVIIKLFTEINCPTHASNFVTDPRDEMENFEDM